MLREKNRNDYRQTAQDPEDPIHDVVNEYDSCQNYDSIRFKNCSVIDFYCMLTSDEILATDN